LALLPASLRPRKPWVAGPDPRDKDPGTAMTQEAPSPRGFIQGGSAAAGRWAIRDDSEPADRPSFLCSPDCRGSGALPPGLRRCRPGPHQRALPSLVRFAAQARPRASPWNPLVGLGEGGALWRKWRGGGQPEAPGRGTPPPDPLPQGEGENILAWAGLILMRMPQRPSRTAAK
jgi:hypothetical protein